MIAQLVPLRNEPLVYVRNLPHMLANGPYSMKCYAFETYLALTVGQ